MNLYPSISGVSLPCCAAVCYALTVAAAPCDFPCSSDTLDLYVGGVRAGILVEGWEHDSGTGGIVERTFMDAELPSGDSGGGGQRLRVEERRQFGPDGVLRTAFQRMVTASGDNTWELTEMIPGRWVLRRTVGGVASEEPARGVPTERVDNACRLYRGILQRSIRTGECWSDTAFDLAFGRRVVSTVTCLAPPSPANGHTWEFLSTDSATGLREHWVTDTNGVTLYRSVPPFFEGRRRGFTGLPGSRPEQLSGSLAALFSVPADRAPTAADRIVVRFTNGVEMPATAVPFYRRERNRWVLRPFLVPCPPELRNRALSIASDDDTASTPTLQSSHPAIVALAESLSVPGEDACGMIHRMCRHVYHRIEYRRHAAYSSALETLNAGYGDCGEKAVLLAALLRARKIPCHVVFGLVYVADKKAYMGHAWVGIRTAAGWLCADPAMGTFPASVGLVPLLVDDRGTAGPDILRLVGRTIVFHERQKIPASP